MSNKEEQIIVGSVVAIIGAIASAITTAAINFVLAGKINLLLVGTISISFGLLLGIILFYRTYRLSKDPSNPFRKMQVTNKSNHRDLLSSEPEARTLDDGRWQYSTGSQSWPIYFSVYGPYLYHLPKGKYRAIFRLKVDNIMGHNQPIIDIDVAAKSSALGDKTLAGRTITPRDFKRSDEYHKFIVDFYILAREGERDVEFRIASRNQGYLVTLDYIRLLKG